jgi:hypothetical protein
MSGQLSDVHYDWVSMFTGIPNLAGGFQGVEPGRSDQTARADQQGANANPGPATAPANGPRVNAATAAPAIAKARSAWLAARQGVERDLGKLHAAIMADYKDHAGIADIDKSVRAKVEPVLDTLDESLAEKLNDIGTNSDPARQADLVEDARKIIDRYKSYIANEPFVAAIDANPFVPLSIISTLTATLSALEKAVA